MTYNLSRQFILTSIAFLLSIPLPVIGNDEFDVSGFISVGAAKSSRESVALRNFGIEDELSFTSDSVLGLQFDFPLNNNAHVSTQILAREFTDNFQLDAEWLYISQPITRELTLRAGRLRLPLFLHSEYYYVAQSYPWVRLPLQVYSLSLAITRYNGVEFAYDYPVTGYDLTLRGIIGKAKENVQFGGLPAELATDLVFGFTIDGKWEDLILHGSYLRPKFDSASMLLPNESVSASAELWSFGTNYTCGNWELNAEAGSVEAKPELSLFQREQSHALGWYTSLAYDLAIFTPVITLAGSRFEDGDTHDNLETYAMTLGLRRDITPRSSLKFEITHGEYIDAPVLFLLPSADSQPQKLNILGLTLNAIF